MPFQTTIKGKQITIPDEERTRCEVWTRKPALWGITEL